MRFGSFKQNMLMLEKTLLTVLFLSCLSSFGQKKATLEDSIYKTIDLIVANPSAENIEKLKNVEHFFWTQEATKTSNELLSIVILNCNKGYYENQLGRTNEAIKSYEKAWLLFQKNKLNHYDIVEYCLKPLGNLYNITADYDGAENTIKQYYFMANHQKEYDKHKTAAILNLCNVYESSGKNNLAISLLKNTLQTEKLSNIQKGILWNNLGTNYMVSANFSQAKKALEASIHCLTYQKSNLFVLSNAYRNLAAIYSKDKQYDLANANFNIAKKLFLESKTEEPRQLAKLYLEEATLFYEQKKWEETLNALQQVYKTILPNYSEKNVGLPPKETVYAETILLDAIDLAALVYFDQKNYAKSLKCYDLSFYIEDLFQSLLVYENSKIISTVRNRKRTEKCLNIYQLLGIKEQRQDYFEKAFLLSEKSKATVLKNYASSNYSVAEKKILESIQVCQSNILREQEKAKLADIDFINEMIKRQNQYSLLLKKSQKNKTLINASALDLKKLYAKLEKESTTMVSYFSGVSTIYCFKLENAKLSMQSVESINETNTVISSFLNFFRQADAIDKNAIAYNRAGNFLYDHLGLSKIYKKNNLLIVPDGLLNFVPFEALIVERSSYKTAVSKFKYLVYDRKITYSNAASFYLNGESITIGKPTVLGVFPIFENTNLELTFSKEEMSAIQLHFQGNFLKKGDATFQNFKKEAHHFSILHLSTHATSGNIVSPAAIRFYDQDVLYSDLYYLNIKPKLVVLSACETGLGKWYKGEGAMSIARGFQVSGAQNLLLSLWKVNDYTTSKLMDNFYQNIHDGLSFSDANHESKIQFLKDPTISNVKKSPYYWAPFVYYGAVENTKESKLWLWVLGSLSIGMLAFFFWKKFKKRVG
jgi:CHAT domain-containing protein